MHTLRNILIRFFGVNSKVISNYINIKHNFSDIRNRHEKIAENMGTSRRK